MTTTVKKYNRILLHLLAALFSSLVIFSRRPDAVLNPQFWAEDGKVWYADAYNNGILYSLLTPRDGYFQTISRLVAVCTQLFSLEYAPLIFNLFGFFVKILVAQFILSKRFANLIPNLKIRILLAFIYLALPNSFEVHVNLTNVQWHLALLSCLVILAEPSVKTGWRIFDFSVLTLSVLSGPLCLFLVPVAALKFWVRREKQMPVVLAILAVGFLIQGAALLSTPRPTHDELGASVKLLSRIIGGQIFFAAVFGEYGLERSIAHSLWKDGLTILVNLFGFGLIFYALAKSSLELRLFILFSSLICIASLISPAASKTMPQWEALRLAGVGGRYWFIPLYCFLIILIFTAAKADSRVLKRVAAIALAVVPFGIVADWKYPPYRNYDFQQYAAEFNKAEVGAEIIIPINPQWEMRLIKKP